MRGFIVSLILFTPLAVAQNTWVVDDDGPADFAKLWTAVDVAGDGDVILVRGGGYEGPIRIEGKSLTIQGEGDVLVYTLWPGGSPFEIRDLQADQSVQLRGLRSTLFTGAANYPPVIELEDNAGPVWIEDCVFDGSTASNLGGSQVRADSCAAVTLSRCSLIAPISSKFFSAGFNPWSGIEATDSSLYLYDCEVKGSDGIDSNAASSPITVPGTSTPAIALFGSTLFASGCTLTGGDGGSDADGLCLAGVDGAPALTLDASAAAAGSTATLLETTLTGGIGGFGGCGTLDGVDAAPLSIVAGSVASIPGAAASLRVDSPVDGGASGTIYVEGAPGDVVFLLVNDTTSLAAPTPGLVGAIHVPVSSSALLALGVLPASGALEFSVAMPALPAPIESMLLFGQALCVRASGVVDGGTSMLLITDPGL